MKKRLLYSLVFVGFSVGSLFAQLPPHPNGGSAPGSGNTPVGGGAPISGGIIILLSLGIGYGTRRIYDIRNRNLNEI
jgi:hypothetical protein